MLKYDADSMNFASGAIKSALTALAQHRYDLDQYLKTNLHPEWQSSSSYAYQWQQQQWNTACDDVHVLLSNLHNALEVAMGNAGAIETALESMWS